MAEYAYDAWGKVLSVTGSMAETVGELNPMRYRGYYYDSETGYYYLQSRYYDPEIGRFINADASHILQLAKDQSGGMNLFAYCFNDPINSVDPTGYIAATAATLILAILAAYTVVSFIVASPSFQNSWNNFCRTIGNGLSWIGGQLSKVASSVRKWSVSQLKAVRSSLDTLTRLTKANTKINQQVKRYRTSYFEINIYSGIPSLGRRITEAVAIQRLRIGRSVITLYGYNARKVAARAGNATPMWHPRQYNLPGYYNHYHVSKHINSAHCFYII